MGDKRGQWGWRQCGGQWGTSGDWRGGTAGDSKELEVMGTVGDIGGSGDIRGLWGMGEERGQWGLEAMWGTVGDIGMWGSS